jgi:hypothetical protein
VNERDVLLEAVCVDISIRLSVGTAEGKAVVPVSD